MYVRLLIALLLNLSFSLCFGQADPYRNGHLTKYFNPQQIDFSKDYLELQSKQYSNKKDQLQQSLDYDYSSIWLTDNMQQNGIIGLNYQRIQIHISEVYKNTPDTYIIKGKSKVNNNICDFKGEIELTKLFFTDCEGSEFSKCAQLFAYYTFYEDSLQNYSGYFSGIMECSVHLNESDTKMLLDESLDIADGYSNRTFIGTWTDYKTNKPKKCIWGDYRLPFTFDFDCGDGEMIVCDKYVNNGWKSYNDGSEYIHVGEDKWELKNKWWIKK